MWLIDEGGGVPADLSQYVTPRGKKVKELRKMPAKSSIANIISRLLCNRTVFCYIEWGGVIKRLLSGVVLPVISFPVMLLVLRWSGYERQN